MPKKIECGSSIYDDIDLRGADLFDGDRSRHLLAARALSEIEAHLAEHAAHPRDFLSISDSNQEAILSKLALLALLRHNDGLDNAEAYGWSDAAHMILGYIAHLARGEFAHASALDDKFARTILLARVFYGAPIGKIPWPN